MEKLIASLKRFLAKVLDDSRAQATEDLADLYASQERAMMDSN